MKQPTAFIIEDDTTLTNIFAQATLAAGYEPEVLTNGETALTRLREIVPALIILDLHLPGRSGEEVLHIIRSDERYRRTRVVVASADNALAAQLKDRADIVLEKPVSFHQLRMLAARLHPSNDTGFLRPRE